MIRAALLQQGARAEAPCHADCAAARVFAGQYVLRAVAHHDALPGRNAQPLHRLDQLVGRGLVGDALRFADRLIERVAEMQAADVLHRRFVFVGNHRALDPRAVQRRQQRDNAGIGLRRIVHVDAVMRAEDIEQRVGSRVILRRADCVGAHPLNAVAHQLAHLVDRLARMAGLHKRRVERRGQIVQR